jgi:hypothetical protein
MGKKSSKSAPVPPANEVEPDGNVAEATPPQPRQRKQRKKSVFILEKYVNAGGEGNPGVIDAWVNATPGNTFEDRRSAEAYPLANKMAGAFRAVASPDQFTIAIVTDTIAKRS